MVAYRKKLQNNPNEPIIKLTIQNRLDISIFASQMHESCLSADSLEVSATVSEYIAKKINEKVQCDACTPQWAKTPFWWTLGIYFLKNML